MSKIFQIKYYKDCPFIFYCPACKTHHFFKTEGDGAKWKWNGDFDKPTISPSILVNPKEYNNPTQPTCHLFIKEGKIQYLSDSTHSLAGQTIEMENIE